MNQASEETAASSRQRRTPEGSSASSANATTHGLTSRAFYGRDSARIEEIAAAFLGGALRSHAAWEAACHAAEAHVDCLRIEAWRLHEMRHAEDDPKTFAEESKSDRHIELGLLELAHAGRPVASVALQDLIYRKYRGPPRNSMRRNVILYGKLASKLQTLGRYAAAARARRRQAIESLDRILAGVASTSARPSRR